MEFVNSSGASTVAEAIRHYDSVIIRTQKLNLHPQWEDAINGFAQSHKRLGDAFLKVFPRRRGEDFMTPKVACVIFDVPRWIKKYNWSLIVVSEQAFEAVHYAYMDMEKLYKIPLTGAELINGQRRWTSDPSWGKKSVKKKRAASKKKSKSKQSTRRSAKTRRATKTLTEKYARARKLELSSVAAFNAMNVASAGLSCQKRMKEAITFNKDADPAKNCTVETMIKCHQLGGERVGRCCAK